jgi:hypothetical protein
LLVGKLIMTLSLLQLGIDLPSMDLRLLLLLIRLLLDREKLHPWLGCHSSHRDRQDGLECQSVLRHRCSGDGDSRVMSRLPKWMVSPGARPTPIGLLSLEMKESFSEVMSHPKIPISECEPFSTINLNFQKNFI